MTVTKPAPEPTAALLPCPFCGGEAHQGASGLATHYVFCRSCGSSSRVTTWNRRAQARTAAPEWRSIDSAPKDGTPILIFQPEGFFYPNGRERHYTQFVHNIGTDYVEYDDWRFAIGYWRPWGGGSWGNRNSAHVHPSHWQPLPSPPVKE